MCLITKQRHWKIAKKDILCYKALDCFIDYREDEYGVKIGDNFTVRYQTPFQCTWIPRDVLDGKRYFRAKGFTRFTKRRHFSSDDPAYEIAGGAIHAWTNMPEAEHHRSYGTGNTIFECAIPKGTRYAEGVEGADICAKKIKFLKRVDNVPET